MCVGTRVCVGLGTHVCKYVCVCVGTHTEHILETEHVTSLCTKHSFYH